MSDRDYLWDQAGPADAEVARLEAALGGLGHDGEPPALGDRRPPRRRRRRNQAISIVAGLVAAAAAIALWLALGGRGERGAAPCRGGAGFRFDAIAGVTRCGGTRVASGTLPVGGWLETGAAGTAELAVADIGRVRVGPRSRVGLIATGPAQHRLSLARGSLHAEVSAPPRLFVVDTPAAQAIDLGCAYDLTVGADGGGTLTVTRGQVELAGAGRVCVVPAGAVARTRTASGPGTPVRVGAPAELIAAVARFDAGDATALDDVLAACRFDDAITMFNLLGACDADARARVIDRLGAIAPPPPGVSRAALVAGDATATGAWRSDLERRDWLLGPDAPSNRKGPAPPR